MPSSTSAGISTKAKTPQPTRKSFLKRFALCGMFGSIKLFVNRILFRIFDIKSNAPNRMLCSKGLCSFDEERTCEVYMTSRFHATLLGQPIGNRVHPKHGSRVVLRLQCGQAIVVPKSLAILPTHSLERQKTLSQRLRGQVRTLPVGISS